MIFFMVLILPLPVSGKKKQKDNFPKIDAKTAIVMNAKNGDVLYHKYMYRKKYPASLTKLMTVLLTLEQCQLNEKVKFSKNAIESIEPRSSNIGMLPGEVITVEQCLYGMMLESANEVCVAVAEHISGSSEQFAKLMTKRAKELGCKNTHFMNPHGLHDDQHYTTAYDTALILKELLKNPTFRRISGSKNFQLKKTNKQPMRWLGNHHKMIRYGTSASYSLSPNLTITSGKTAFTTKAKTCLSTSATDGSMELICIVMDDAGICVYWDTKALLEHAYEHYYEYNPVRSYPSLKVNKKNIIAYNFMHFQNSKPLPLAIPSDFTITLPKKTPKNKISKKVIEDIDYSKNLYGYMNFYFDHKKIATTPIYFKSFTEPIQKMDNNFYADLLNFNPDNLLVKINENYQKYPEYYYIGAGAALLSMAYLRLIIKRRSLRKNKRKQAQK